MQCSSLDTVARAGSPVAWKLMPQAAPLLLAKPDSAIAKRGAFAQKNLWVTPHSDQVGFNASQVQTMMSSHRTSCRARPSRDG